MNDINDNMAEVARVIDEVVGYYARRTGYGYDKRDLSQKAWIVAIESFQRWSPEKGPIAPYLATALRIQLGSTLVNEHAPVCSSKAERKALYNTRRVSMTPDQSGAYARPSGAELFPMELVEASIEQPRNAEDMLDVEVWQAKVATRVREVVGPEGQEGLTDLLRDGPRPQLAGAPTCRLEWSRATACTRIAQDAELRELILSKV